MSGTGETDSISHLILLSESPCAYELEKAQLLLQEKDKEIALLNEKIVDLNRIIKLMENAEKNQ
jgi:hypothetical protein